MITHALTKSSIQTPCRANLWPAVVCGVVLLFILIPSASISAVEAEMATHWTGTTSASHSFRIVTTRTAAGWEALWRLIGQPPPRTLNENTEMAVGIFLGLRRTGGYGIKILSMHSGPIFEKIYFSELRPDEGSFVPQVLTSPYAVQMIKKSRLPVVVFRNDGAVFTTESETTRIEDLVMEISEECNRVQQQIEHCEAWAKDVIRYWKQKCDNGTIGPAPWE